MVHRQQDHQETIRKGLKRTGKSCRLRWVNYLHPGLKRGKMTPHEERLVLDLHKKWGNRWSRIARKLPGRTDNEIKNYWRTHMRKKAQEKKKLQGKNPNISPSSSSSSFSANSSHSSLFSSNSPDVDSMPIAENNERNFYDTGGVSDAGADVATAKAKKTTNTAAGHEEKETEFESLKVYSMDDIWNQLSEDQFSTGKSSVNYTNPIVNGHQEDGCGGMFSSSYQSTMMASPIWDFFGDSLWMMEDHDQDYYNTMSMMSSSSKRSDYNFSNQEITAFLTG